MKRLTFALLLLLGSGPVYCVQAQWAVEDLTAFVQRTAIWVEEAAQWGASLKNQADSIVNEYNIILNQIKSYETMIKNLQRMPEGLNVFQAIQAYGNQVSGLLGQATMLSFNLDQSARQFDALYGQIAPLTSAAGVLDLRQKFASAKMEMSGVTVQVTSIKQNLTDLYTRICSLLSGSLASQGNLDHQQVMAQQNALMQHTMETIAAMQATNARLFAQDQAEQAAMERLRLEAIKGAMEDSTPYTTPNGHLPKWSW